MAKTFQYTSVKETKRRKEAHETCTMAWRVTDLAPLENRKLTLHTLRLFFISSDDMESANTFSIQPRVLRETLNGMQ